MMLISQQCLVSASAWRGLVSGSQPPWAWGCAERQGELAGLGAGGGLSFSRRHVCAGACLQGCDLWLTGLGGLIAFTFPQVRELGFVAQATKLEYSSVFGGFHSLGSLGLGKTHQNSCVLAEG